MPVYHFKDQLRSIQQDIIVGNSNINALQIGSSAVKSLIVALQEGNINVRCYVANILAEIRDPQAVDPLIVALQDEDEYVRECIANALGVIGDPRAIPALEIISAQGRCEESPNGVAEAARKAIIDIQKQQRIWRK